MVNSPLENVQTFKYLGVILDQEIQFKTHAQCIYELALHEVNILRRIRSYVNQYTALMMYL